MDELTANDLVREFLVRNRRRRLQVHCVGDAMVDEYYSVKVNRISPEFPMPIMSSDHASSVKLPGGVANVAYQFRHFNVDARLVCIADDEAEHVFSAYGVTRWDALCRIRGKLPVKQRFLDGDVQVTRRDVEVPLCMVPPELLEYFLCDYGKVMAADPSRPDVAVLSDYDKGFFSCERQRVLDFYRGCTTVVDPKRGPLSKWKGCTIFKPNAAEAIALTGLTGWADQAKYLRDTLECEAVVITHGGDYVAGVSPDGPFCHKPLRTTAARSVVGAGDCFGAVFAMAVGHGFPVPDAVVIAQVAGGAYVAHKMNRPVCPADLITDGVIAAGDLAARDFKLVLANGCFDILHRGHLETLKAAKGLGDRLVVAVNSDASVARLKGPTRPVVPLEDRMRVLAALKWVDYVVPFDEDTPLEVIKAARPDVLVKGSQYLFGEVVGSDLVGAVHYAPMVAGVSTSQILNRLESGSRP